MRQILKVIRSLPSRLRQSRARRRIRRLGSAESLPVDGDATRIGSQAARLSQLAAAGIPIQPGLVLDAATLARLQAMPAASAAKIERHYAHALRTTVFVVSTDQGTRRVAAEDLHAALAGASAPLLLQADCDNAVAVTGRVAGWPGQWAITASNQRGVFGRLTGQHRGGDLGQIDPAPLHALLARVEKALGQVCEVRVARVDVGLQVCSCSGLAALHPLDQEVDRLIDVLRSRRGGPVSSTEPLFVASPLSESVPRPTPSTLDLLRAMSDTAAAPMTVLGRLMCLASPTQKPSRAISPWQRHRHLAHGRAFATELRATRLAERRAALVLLAAIDLEALTADEVLQLWRRERRHFITGAHADAEQIAAISALAGDEYRSRAAEPVPRVRPQWQQALLSAARDRGGAERIETMHRIAGHRASLDLELAQPRYREVPGALDVLALAAAAKATDPLQAPVEGSAAELAALADDARHEALRHFDILRQILLDLDRRFGLGGKIFELHHDEIESLSAETAGDLRSRAAHRQRERGVLMGLPVPSKFVTADDLEQMASAPLQAAATTTGARIRGRGTRVSGGAVVTGRAYVVSVEAAESGLELDDFRDGDILVTSRVHPCWLDLLARGSGVVSEWGDADGPVAIAAREHGVAMITGLPNAGQFRTGDRLILHADGRVTAEPEVVWRLRLVERAADGPPVMPLMGV